MSEVEVVGVRIEMPANTPIVLLREKVGDRFLPIWIGTHEASAIAFAQQGVVPPRPLTHDLLLDLITALNSELQKVVIDQLRDGVFFAELIFLDGVTVSARPSDAIALALRAQAPIEVAEEVLAQASVEVPAEEEDEVERFREFLDSVTPEDFDGS